MLGYVDKDCLKAGLNNAKDFFKNKDVGGKALAIVTALGAIIFDKLCLFSLIGAPFTALPMLESSWAQSGLGQAFHHGVKAAYAEKHPGTATSKEKTT